MSEKYDIRRDVLYALIKIESGGCEFATRFEPGYKAYFLAEEYAKENLITTRTEEVHQATSWGLMQIMGATARRLGLEGPIVVLLDPGVNLEYGCKLLQELKQRYPKSLYDQVAAYNAGKVRLDANGLYKNERYVRKFKKAFDQLTL